MKRVLRLWRLYATMDLLFLARGPQVALAFYVSDVLIGVAAATATFLLAERFNGIGSWTRAQVLFMLGYALLVRMLINLFFNYNLAHISRRIGRGQLDHMLVQPQPLWTTLLTEGFSPFSGSGMLLPTVLLFGAALPDLRLPASPTWFGLFVVYVLASMLIVQSFEYAWGSLAFWAPRGAEEINSHTWDLLQQLIPFPLDGLSGVALAGLVSIIPAGLVAWYPTRALLGISPVAWPEAASLPGVAVLFGALALWVFTRGLRQHARTGSSRYLDYGHRR